MAQIHATCVSLDGDGLLIRGDSASGKSDLALRLIKAGADLVADDRVDIDSCDGRVIASAPLALRGLIEVRGIGLVEFPHRESAAVAAVIDLVDSARIERLPEPAFETMEGILLPHFLVDPFKPSAVHIATLVIGLATGSIKRRYD